VSGFTPQRRPPCDERGRQVIDPSRPGMLDRRGTAVARVHAVPPLRLAQRASDLLRELNLLLCGATEDELQHILAAMAATQALATARLREERGHSL
jgi:hypothetical protein